LILLDRWVAKKKLKFLKFEVRSNTDNEFRIFKDKYGNWWPKASPFDESPSERNYQKDGYPVLVAVNDDYTEKQKKSGEWVKDNIAGDADGIVELDKSLQNGKLYVPIDIADSRLKWQFTENIKVWWKLPGADDWTEIPKEDGTEFKKFTDGMIPLKLEGITKGSARLEVTFIIGKIEIKDSFNYKVLPTVRMVACYGKFEKVHDPIKSMVSYLNKELKPIVKKVAPKGRFELRVKKASRKLVVLCAKNQYPHRNPQYRYPHYWTHFFLFAHGGKPVYTSLNPFCEKYEDRAPKNPEDILKNGVAVAKYNDNTDLLGDTSNGGLPSVIQQLGTNKINELREAIKLRKELDSLPLKPEYKQTHGLVSYLSFNRGGFWPRELLGIYDPNLTILELSCWNWWAGGKGKTRGIDCVTVGERGKQVKVFMDGAGTPFPLYSHFVCPETQKHILNWFKD